MWSCVTGSFLCEDSSWGNTTVGSVAISRSSVTGGVVVEIEAEEAAGSPVGMSARIVRGQKSHL